MSDHVEYTCIYEDGSRLEHMVSCPSDHDGAVLTDTEVHVVEDVTASPFPWWILILLGLILATNNKK